MDYQVDAPCGQLRGMRGNGVNVFRGIPYAAAPVGELRFKPPQELPPWEGVHDARAEPPISPQGKSRLVAVTGGDFTLPQSEACLTLNVTAPSQPSAPLPVLVWIHGGGFMGGAGSLPWYAAETLVRRGEIVVVNLNFRQGVLGHLYLPGVSPGNLALLDIVAGLQWVKHNISAFGGDPDQVTAWGQSSGAAAVVALLDMPKAEGLFQRAIIQSAPLGRPLRSVQQAVQLGERFAELLGVDPFDADAFRSAPLEDILRAQGEYARAFRPPVVGASEQPFAPVVDNEVLLARGQGWGHQRGRSVDLLLGTLREEQAAAYSIDPAVQSASWEQVAESFRHIGGSLADEAFSYYARRRPGGSPAAVLGDLFTDILFRLDSLRFADDVHRNTGRAPWVYQFDWPSPAGFEACHCLDLPFVFGSLEPFSDAPMLDGVEPGFFQGLSEAMQDAWIAFARDGDPNHEKLPAWPRYGHERYTLRLDRQLETLKDLAGFDSHPLR